MNTYFYIAIIFFNLILFLNYKKISKIYNLYDIPDNIRKKHEKNTPLFGGLIILINLLIYCILEYFKFFEFSFFKTKYEILIFLFSSILFYLIGFFDDKYQLKPNFKLLIFTFLIIILMILDNDLIISNINFTFSNFVFYFYNYSYFFTILCFLLFINSFNMLDGINGQATSYAIFISIILIFLKFNLIFFTILLIPLLIFLFYNLKNKMFLGDSGTLLLGFVFSYFFIKSYNLGLKIYSDEIFLIMMIPGLELVRLAVQRLLLKKHPFSPDNKHIHHLIIDRTSFLNSYVLIQILLVFPFILYLLIDNSIISLIISFLIYSFLMNFLLKKIN